MKEEFVFKHVPPLRHGLAIEQVLILILQSRPILPFAQIGGCHAMGCLVVLRLCVILVDCKVVICSEVVAAEEKSVDVCSSLGRNPQMT
jgi:hypothetical protein